MMSSSECSGIFDEDSEMDHMELADLDNDTNNGAVLWGDDIPIDGDDEPVSVSDEEMESMSTSMVSNTNKRLKHEPIPLGWEFGKETLRDKSDVVTVYEQWLIDFKHLEVVSRLSEDVLTRDLYKSQQRGVDRLLWMTNRQFSDIRDKQQFVREAKYSMQFIHPALAEMKGFSIQNPNGRPAPSILYESIDGFTFTVAGSL